MTLNKNIMKALDQKKPIIINPRLKTMDHVTTKARRINKKLVLMKSADGLKDLSAIESKKLIKNKTTFMQAFSTSKAKKPMSLKGLPEQEALKTRQVKGLAEHIQIRLQYKDGNVTIAKVRKVQGEVLNDDVLHVNAGLVYEVRKGNKRLQFGVIPDFGERRGYPSPNPKTPAQEGHSIKALDEFVFNVRIPAKGLSLSSLRRLNIDLFRVKSGIENQVVSNKLLENQFDDKFRKVASMQRINPLKLSVSLKKDLKKIF